MRDENKEASYMLEGKKNLLSDAQYTHVRHISLCTKLFFPFHKSVGGTKVPSYIPKYTVI